MQTTETGIDQTGERFRERGLADAWDVFYEEMAAGDQTDDSEANDLILAEENLGERAFEVCESWSLGKLLHACNQSLMHERSGNGKI